MEHEVARLIALFESGAISRRQLIKSLAVAGAAMAGALGVSAGTVQAQPCDLAYSFQNPGSKRLAVLQRVTNTLFDIEDGEIVFQRYEHNNEIKAIWLNSTGHCEWLFDGADSLRSDAEAAMDREVGDEIPQPPSDLQSGDKGRIRNIFDNAQIVEKWPGVHPTPRDQHLVYAVLSKRIREQEEKCVAQVTAEFIRRMFEEADPDSGENLFRTACAEASDADARAYLEQFIPTVEINSEHDWY